MRSFSLTSDTIEFHAWFIQVSLFLKIKSLQKKIKKIFLKKFIQSSALKIMYPKDH